MALWVLCKLTLATRGMAGPGNGSHDVDVGTALWGNGNELVGSRGPIHLRGLRVVPRYTR